MENREFISIEDVAMWYPYKGKDKAKATGKKNWIKAVDGVSLSIKKGEILGIIGESGCGKSTYLKTLNRMNDLVSNVKIDGTVLLDGEDIYDPQVDTTLLRKKVGMVFQQPNPFPMSIYDNVAYGPRIHGIKNKAQLDEIVERSLKGAALWDEVSDRLKKSALGLSGGQQQRVALARAIVLEPKILCLDEPLSNLDAKLRVGLRSELKRLQKTLGITTLYVTHDQEEALTLSDKIAVFNNGFVEQVDVPFNIYNHSKSEFVCDFIGEINHLSKNIIREMNQQCDIKLEEDKNSYVRLERVGFKPVQGAARFIRKD